MRGRALALASMAVVGIGLMSGATPAAAVESAPKAREVRHCVTDVSASKPSVACYDSFTVAVAKATGGRITDAPNDVGAAMRDARLQARLNALHMTTKNGVSVRAQAPGPAVIFYSGTLYRGDSYIFTSNRNCTPDLNTPDFRVAYVGDDQNDEYESFKAYRDCRAKLFADRDFRGVSLPYDTFGLRLYQLADEVSSFYLS